MTTQQTVAAYNSLSAKIQSLENFGASEHVLESLWQKFFQLEDQLKAVGF